MSTFSRLLAFTALLFALTGPCVAETTAPLDKAQVEKELWAKEQAIYAGRGRGDLQPYYDNTLAGRRKSPNPWAVESSDRPIKPPWDRRKNWR
jgi:hypothetical protein